MRASDKAYQTLLDEIVEGSLPPGAVLAEVEQSLLVASKHLDYLFDGLQLAAHRVVRPSFEESLCRTLVAVAPELAEVFLDAPGPARLQVEPVQGPKGHSLRAASIGVPLEPCPFAACQRGCARLGQFAVLLLSERVHRLTKVLGDMKLVVHDISLWHALSGGTHVRRPHIHGHCLDRCTLRRRERLQQSNGRFKFSLRHQVQYPRAVNVSQYAGVGVAPVGTLLINAQVDNLFLGTPEHALVHCADHDGIDRTPRQSCESAYALRGGTGLKQFDDEASHHVGDPAVALGPGHRQLFNSAVAVFELGNPGFDDRLKLACVQVAPLALAPTIDVSPLGRIRRVRLHLSLLQNNFDNHTLVCQRKLYRSDRPRRLQSKKLLIQRGVLHTCLDIFEKLDCLLVSKKLQ